MNNAKFKEFISPLLDKAVNLLGGAREAQVLYEQLPEQTIYFVAGVLHGLVHAQPVLSRAPWRDEESAAAFIFTHEEKRRMLDYVRLRFETGSGTS